MKYVWENLNVVNYYDGITYYHDSKVLVSNVIELRPEQPAKALFPIEMTELGIVTAVSPLHPSKAQRPIEVTEVGKVTEIKPEQPQNALSPIEVTDSGMVTEVSIL